MTDEQDLPSSPTANKLHGRRSGRPIAAHKRDLLRSLLPRLSLDPTAAIEPSICFPPRVRDVWLEVGFGAGEHLIAVAASHPDVGLIGCEPFLNGMARALTSVAAVDLDNVRLHCGDAAAVVTKLPPACLGRVFVLFPDPWPKRRQRKRRFLSDAMLSELARVMRAGAELRVATDIDDKCGWTLSRMLRSADFDWTAERAEDWQRPWVGWTATRYERKAVSEGRRPCYLTARRR